MEQVPALAGQQHGGGEMGDYLPNGIRVIVADDCLESIVIDRTLKERWLSWPWRPWVKTREKKVPAIYKVMNPSRGAGWFGPSYFLLAHPQKMAELREASTLAGDGQ